MGALEDTLRARGFRMVWVVDTEYRSEGGRPRPRCLCARDLLSGERREVWLAGVARPLCPFAMADDECFIFFAADADVGVFIKLQWPIPRHVIDVRVEFMRIRNGLAPLPPLDGGDPDIAAAKEAKAFEKAAQEAGSILRFRGSHAITGFPSSTMTPKATFAISPCAQGMNSPTSRRMR